MCGIVGYIGQQKALPILIKGLKRLEYRGYDSAGVAYLKEQSIEITKSVGKIQDLEKRIDWDVASFMGIGHTRWATHGKVTVMNCHPHKVGKVVLVHNGILENYQTLKKDLLEHGYTFQGDTDSEVAAAYIDFLYEQRNGDFIGVLEECVSIFEGSYAIVFMIQGIKDRLFVLKKDSPLVLGIGEEEIYVASDPFAFKEETNSFVFLEDLDYGIVWKDSIQLYQNKKEKELDIITLKKEEDGVSTRDFSHYMLKEIYEQVDLVKRWNSRYLDHFEVIPDLSVYSKIHIVGCGTAYHAGLVGKYLLEEYDNLDVRVFIASEYRYQKLSLDKFSLVIFVSQSGETADTLACLKRVKESGCATLGIVNVEFSSIAREVDQVLYTKAGSEIAVASTKAYLAQIYVFSLLAFRLGIQQQKLDFRSVCQAYFELPDLVQKMLNYPYEEIVQDIWQKKDVFFLGRNMDYVTMMEGALKLKEISYLHAEAFPAGELKHGTISLIENGTPVIALLSKEELALKTLSNVEEVKSRGASLLLLIRDSLGSKIQLEETVSVIWIPSSIELLQPLLNVIPLQMLAYTVAKMRGVDIDQPRNLAKSVTVE